MVIIFHGFVNSTMNKDSSNWELGFENQRKNEWRNRKRKWITVKRLEWKSREKRKVMERERREKLWEEIDWESKG